MFTAIITCIVLAFLYRLRGGGYITLTHATLSRLIWACGMAVAYALQGIVDFWSILAVLMSSYLALTVPHAYCQNMGKWPTPQKAWPSFFFPDIDPNNWTKQPMWRRAAYDAGQMACVGLVRGAIVFGLLMPFYALNYGAAGITTLLYGIFTIGVLQPIAYLLGAYVMFFNAPSCTKFSAEWGEFLNGAAWGIALAVAA